MATNQPILVHIIFALAALGADIYLLNTELSAKQLQNINDNLHQLDWIIHDSEINTLPAVKTLPIHHYNQTSVQSLLNASVPSNPVKRKVAHCSKLTVLTSGNTGCFKMAGRSSKAQNFISPFYQLFVKLNLSHYQKYTLPHQSTMALV
jgi:fatty-acyl-CoA synthase